jgi:hypothetical protein
MEDQLGIIAKSHENNQQNMNSTIRVTAKFAEE